MLDDSHMTGQVNKESRSGMLARCFPCLVIACLAYLAHSRMAGNICSHSSLVLSPGCLHLPSGSMEMRQIWSHMHHLWPAAARL